MDPDAETVPEEEEIIDVSSGSEEEKEEQNIGTVPFLPIDASNPNVNSL